MRTNTEKNLLEQDQDNRETTNCKNEEYTRTASRIRYI